MMFHALILVILAQPVSSQQQGCASAAGALIQADQRRGTGEHRHLTETEEETHSRQVNKARNNSKQQVASNSSEFERELEHANEVFEAEHGLRKKNMSEEEGTKPTMPPSTPDTPPYTKKNMSVEGTKPTMPPYTDIDGNKDGVLTPKEFQNKRSKEIEAIEKKVAEVIQQEKVVEDAKLTLERQIDTMPSYENIDGNKDGVVTPAEYQASSNTAMAKQLSYKVLDENADGAVTPDNFKHASETWAAGVKAQIEEQINELARVRAEQRKLEQELDSLESYEDLDKQRDGVITRSEYRQHVQAAKGSWSVESPAAAMKVPGSQAAGASSANQNHQVQKAGSATTGLGFVCLAVLVTAL